MQYQWMDALLDNMFGILAPPCAASVRYFLRWQQLQLEPSQLLPQQQPQLVSRGACHQAGSPDKQPSKIISNHASWIFLNRSCQASTALVVRWASMLNPQSDVSGFVPQLSQAWHYLQGFRHVVCSAVLVHCCSWFKGLCASRCDLSWDWAPEDASASLHASAQGFPVRNVAKCHPAVPGIHPLTFPLSLFGRLINSKVECITKVCNSTCSWPYPVLFGLLFQWAFPISVLVLDAVAVAARPLPQSVPLPSGQDSLPTGPTAFFKIYQPCSRNSSQIWASSTLSNAPSTLISPEKHAHTAAHHDHKKLVTNLVEHPVAWDRMSASQFASIQPLASRNGLKSH